MVNDDTELQETLQAALEFEDYEVVIAEDGLEASEKLTSRGIALTDEEAI